jgi:hypothetical protein
MRTQRGRLLLLSNDGIELIVANDGGVEWVQRIRLLASLSSRGSGHASASTTTAV